jgi:hypothetical protein
MIVGCMQPYLFPYIGYFQLMNISDVFVIHDDVQYIKGGWINRNRLLLNGGPHLFTFSVEKSSYYLNINQRIFTDSLYSDKLILLRFLESNYRKAPYFGSTMKLVEVILENEERNVSEFICHSLRYLIQYMGIKCYLVKSSDLQKDNSLKAQDRVINIVETVQGDHYINPIGGTELYNKEDFDHRNIKLNFIRTDFSRTIYNQFGKPFVPGLSIIDVLMFNPLEATGRLLAGHDLL